MKHSLAKELRDAGFPQIKEPNFNQGYWFHGMLMEERVYIPTLEELIEACGERFSDLSFSLVTEWCATAHPSTGYNYFGSTPTEAVARLWLALNKI